MTFKKILSPSAPYLMIGAAISIAVFVAFNAWHRPATELVVDNGLQHVRGEWPWIKADTGYGTASGNARSTFKTGTEDLPKSLQDTEVPDGLAEDSSGNLIVSQGLRDIIEYFLSAMVDEPPATLHSRLVAYIRSHVGSKAAQQALTILDQYDAYKLAMLDLAKNYSGDRTDQVAARQAAIRNLRRSSLGPEVAQAFFGEEEAWLAYTVNRSEVLQDNNLSTQQKAARIAELKKSLSTNQQQSIATAEMLSSLEEVRADWKKRGGSLEELRAARETIVGKAGAARLEALDRENAAWDGRISAHLAQRAQILADVSIAQEMKGSRIQALPMQNFTSEERARALALEGLQDEMASASAAVTH